MVTVKEHPEVLRRLAVFRAQLSRQDLSPVFFLPGCEETPEDSCISCGEPLEGGRYRWAHCLRAVVLALGRLEGP